MCSTQLTDLEDLEPLRGQEIAVAGLVVGVQHLTTRTGKNFGKFKLEDYNGAHEFALFGKDYENFRKYLFENYYLMIRGKVQPRPYGDVEQLEFKVLSMMQLQEEREPMIRQLHLQLPVGELTDTLIRELAAQVKASKGDTLLRIHLYDPETNVSLRLFSKRYRIEVSQTFVDFLEQNELKFSITS